jgi:hypothetical protein
MKRLLILVLSFISVNSFAQPWKTITGNGQLKKETRNVEAFTALASLGAIDVEISYGNSKSITLEMDENLLPYIETNVENGKLTIRPKKYVNIKSREKMTVRVSMTKVTSLQESGSGNISGAGAFYNDEKTSVAISGSGNIKFGFDSFKELNLALSGSGNLNLKEGKSESIEAHISGSGNIDCSNISSNEVVAQISGSGNIKVNAKNNIDAKISGSGNVFYKGNSVNIKSQIAGSGKVVKM